MAIITRAGSSALWTEFWFDGKRYRQTTGTKNRRKAEEFERKLRQRVHDKVKLGHVDYQPMRFDEAVRRYTTTRLSTKTRRERTAKAETYALKKLRKLAWPR